MKLGQRIKGVGGSAMPFADIGVRVEYKYCGYAYLNERAVDRASKTSSKATSLAAGMVDEGDIRICANLPPHATYQRGILQRHHRPPA